jgi:hypothetical protein
MSQATHITVRVPMTIRRRPGWKTVVALVAPDTVEAGRQPGLLEPSSAEWHAQFDALVIGSILAA